MRITPFVGIQPSYSFQQKTPSRRGPIPSVTSLSGFGNANAIPWNRPAPVNTMRGLSFDEIGSSLISDLVSFDGDLQRRVSLQYPKTAILNVVWRTSYKPGSLHVLEAAQEVSEAFERFFQMELNPQILATLWDRQHRQSRGDIDPDAIISSLQDSLDTIERFRIRQFPELWNEAALSDLVILLDDRDDFRLLENREASIRSQEWLANGLRSQSLEVWHRLYNQSGELWKTLDLANGGSRRVQFSKLRKALMKMLTPHDYVPARLVCYSAEDQVLVPLSLKQILDFLDDLGIKESVFQGFAPLRTAMNERFPRLANLALAWGPSPVAPNLSVDAAEAVRLKFQEFFGVDFNPEHLAAFLEMERSLVNFTTNIGQNYVELSRALRHSLEAMEFFYFRLLPDFWREENVKTLLDVFQDQGTFQKLSSLSRATNAALNRGKYQLNGVTPERQKALLALIQASQDWYETLQKDEDSRAPRAKNLVRRLRSLLTKHRLTESLDRRDFARLHRDQPWIC